jgi:tetratricopeptide (TPR) repeat protein
MTTSGEIERFFNDAVRRHQSGDLQGALVAYDEVLRTDPESTDAWFNKANILGQQKSFDQAMDCYQEALRLAKSRKELILRSMGMIEHLRGNLQRAIDLHRQALRENRRYGRGWLGLIQALISARRGEEAREECQKFMLNATVEDGALYDKATRLVDQFLRHGIMGETGESEQQWMK